MTPLARPHRSGPTRRLRLLLAAVVPLALVVLAQPAALAAPAAGGDPAWVRAAHLVPDLGPMDIRLSPFVGEGKDSPAEEDPVLQTTAAYGAVGEYSALPAGSYAVSLRPAGAPVSQEPLLTLTLDLEAGQAYTVAGIGTVDQPRLERLVDDLTPPGDGQASVRLIAASRQAPAVDVQAQGGPVLARGAALGEPTSYRQTPAGPWTITAAGQGRSGASDVVLDGGNVYTLLVLDGDGDSLVVRPVVDAVGVGTTPVGAAATGLGGLAPASSATGWWVAAAGGGLLGVLLVVAALVRTGTGARVHRAGGLLPTR